MCDDVPRMRSRIAGGRVSFLVGREPPSEDVSAQIAYNLSMCYEYCAACRNGDSSTTGAFRNGRAVQIYSRMAGAVPPLSLLHSFSRPLPVAHFLPGVLPLFYTADTLVYAAVPSYAL